MDNATAELVSIRSILRESNERDVNVQIARFEELLRQYLMGEGVFEHRGGFVNLCTTASDIAKKASKKWSDDYMQTSSDFDDLSVLVDRPYRREE